MPPASTNGARAIARRRKRPQRAHPRPLAPATPAPLVAAPPVADSIGYIDRELSAVRGELARTDGKCGTLTAIATGAAAFIGTQLHTALPARVVLALALAAYAGSILLLLLALRPSIRPGGWHRILALSVDHTARLNRLAPTATTTELAARDLHALVALAVRKFTQIRLATDLIGAGTLLLAVGLITAAWS